MNTASVTKKDLMEAFKDYKRMDRKLQKKLIDMGFEIIPAKKHYKLYFNGQMFILSTTSSDYRAGKNMVSLIAKAL